MSANPIPANPDPPVPEFMTANEAAAFLRMSLAWVRLKTRTGELPHHKIGTRVLYSRDDLRAYAAGHRKGAKKKKAT
jgi:excisionase family DNA binding protein